MAKKPSHPLPLIDPNRRHKIAEVAVHQLQSVSRTYQQAKSGGLPAFTNGQRHYAGDQIQIDRPYSSDDRS